MKGKCPVKQAQETTLSIHLSLPHLDEEVLDADAAELLEDVEDGISVVIADEVAFCD